jgi:Leucine rich repeat
MALSKLRSIAVWIRRFARPASPEPRKPTRSRSRMCEPDDTKINVEGLHRIAHKLNSLAAQFEAAWQELRPSVSVLTNDWSIEIGPGIRSVLIHRKYNALADALLIKAYCLGGLRADRRWQNIIRTGHRLSEQHPSLCGTIFTTICWTLTRLPVRNRYDFNQYWSYKSMSTAQGKAAAIRLLASRLLLPPEDPAVRVSHKRQRKELYRLKPQQRVVRSPYIEAAEPRYTGEYRSLEDALTEPDRVHRLWEMGDPELEVLPAEIGKFTNASFLYFFGAKLRALPDEIGNLIYLTRLDVGHNRLEALPPAIGSLRRLQRLWISNNDLAELPDSISELTKLTEFHASNNRIEVVPEGIGNLNMLTELDLGNNRLSTLPENIGNLRVLRRLDLRGNQLSTLPESIRNLTELTDLDLRNNPRLTCLPAGLKVHRLNLSGCGRLASLPDDIVVTGWTELAGTSLTSLPGTVNSDSIRWRGVWIDKRIAFRPHTITFREIINERNVERRRVMLERMGYENFLRKARAEVLDRDRDRGGERRLLRVALDPDEPLVCLSVVDPSTGRQYVLRVPPNITTCRHAAAWIAGFDNPDDYQPIIEM